MKTFNTLILLTLLLANPLFSQQEHSRKDIIVQFQPGVAEADFVEKMAAQLPSAVGLKLKKPLAPRFGIYLLSFENDLENASLPAFLEKQSQVKSARFDQAVTFRDSIPNDPLFETQWDMKLIEAPQVWEISTGGQTAVSDEIVVAVLDKGFDLSHEEFAGSIWQNPGEIPGDGNDNDGNGYADDVNGWNFRDSSPEFSVENHGTWVAGTIGAKGNNGKGLAGVNWNVKLMFLGVEYASEVVEAFQYVLALREKYNQTNGAEGAFVVVTNGSFGLDGVACEEQPTWGESYDPLGEAGVLSVAATANEDWDVDVQGDIPTSCPSEYLISVTSTDSNDLRAPNAAYGKVSIDLAAPGKGTTTTNTLQRYKEDFGGTSSACPHVAGGVALLYSLPCSDLAASAKTQPAQTARLVRDAIFEGVDPVASLQDKTATGGRLNLFNSMVYLHSYCIAHVEERAAGNFHEVYTEEIGFVRLRPNPVHDELVVEFSTVEFADFPVRVFNAFGQEITTKTATAEPFVNQTLTLDVSDWANGTYFISYLENGKKTTRKFVKM